MAYFTDQTLEFFRQLKLNNNRDWFNAHKTDFEKDVKEPMTALVENLLQEVRRLEPDYPVIPAKDYLFRIYRDTRFAKDKSPYKEHIGAYLCKKGKKSEYPGFYFHVTNDEAFVGGGLWQLSPPTLKQVRHFLQMYPQEFLKTIQEPNFKARMVFMDGEKNKVIPVEFRETAKEFPIIAYKQFFFTAKYQPEDLLKDDLAERLKQDYRIGLPFIQYFARAFEW